MSANGNGDDDDDIDKLVDALRDTNRNLESVSEKLDVLVNSMIQGAREEVGEEDDESDFDQWASGRVSPDTPTTPSQYVQMRKQSARSSEIRAPKYSSSSVGIGIVEFYVEVYRMKSEHLQKIFQSMGQSDWKEFVQELAIGYGVERGLVDILNPGPATFGIEVIDREVSILQSATHFNYFELDNNIWFAPTADFPVIDPDGVDNLSTFDLIENNIPGGAGEGEGVFFSGSVPPSKVNSDLAETIDDRRGMSLPERFRGFL